MIRRSKRFARFWERKIEMRKIILACSAGLSTSLLVSRMQEAAQQMGYACSIEAVPIDDLMTTPVEVDMILLGPQIRFKLKQIKASYNCPIEVVDMPTYAVMNGAKVMKHVVEVLGE